MRRSVLYLVLMVFLLAACAPAATATPAPAVEATSAPAASASGPAVCTTDAFGCAVIAKGQNVKVGYAGPLAGDYAAYGQDQVNAMLLAIKDAGDINGWTIEMVAQDDGASAEGGAAVANKMVSDPNFVAIAGPAFSGDSSAAMPIFEKAGVPMMSPSATNPELTAKGSKVFNRNAFTDADQAKAAAAYLSTTLGVKKLAVMHDGSDYGQGIANGVKDNFTAAGGEVVAMEAITPGEGDYSAPLAAISSSKPEAIYFGGYNAEASVLVNQMKQAGLDNVKFFGGDGIFGTDFLTKAGKNGEGAFSTTMVPPTSDARTAFDAAFKAAYGMDAGTITAYTWGSYDAMAALLAVIKQVAVVEGDSLYIPREALVNGVRSLKDFQGVAGVISCSDVGECNASGPIIYTVKDGAWTAVTE